MQPLFVLGVDVIGNIGSVFVMWQADNIDQIKHLIAMEQYMI